MPTKMKTLLAAAIASAYDDLRSDAVKEIAGWSGEYFFVNPVHEALTACAKLQTRNAVFVVTATDKQQFYYAAALYFPVR